MRPSFILHDNDQSVCRSIGNVVHHSKLLDKCMNVESLEQINFFC